jgi:acyl-CoA thioester hydrolase
MSKKYSATYRVYYEDTDAQRVMYYANYLKFAERARTDFLRDLKITQVDLMQKENLIFVVKKCTIDYIAPALLDDLITVSVEVKSMSNTSMVLLQNFTRDEKILTTIEVVIVCVDAVTIRPKRIPENIRILLSSG